MKALEVDTEGCFQSFPYDPLPTSVTIAQLIAQESQRAWLSLLLYNGGLTFDSVEPSKMVRIPNLIAAKRLFQDLLSYLNIESNDIRYALSKLEKGDPRPVLQFYHSIMVQTIQRLI